jgi:hypothetical protein
VIRVVKVDGVDHVQELDAKGEPVGDLKGPEYVAEMAIRAAAALPRPKGKVRVVTAKEDGRTYEQDLDGAGKPTGDFREI